MKRFQGYFLPMAALLSFSFATYHIVRGQETPPPGKPPVEPARPPFSSTVAGSGTVEARSENIAVGSHLPGVVDRVLVAVGTPVKKNQPLFRLDGRQLEAELAVRTANLAAAQAQFSRLKNMPRAEELPPVEAKHREAQEALAQQKDLFDRATSAFERRVMSREELVQRQQLYRMAKEQAAKAQADYQLMKAGAWDKDLAVSAAAVAQAEALLQQTRTELDRLVVKSPIDGQVLQLNVRPGEFVGAPPTQTLAIVGDVNVLHVRVDIDEHDIPRFRALGKAQASVRGDASRKFALTLQRVEPLVIPKKSLTGDSVERVDTRVLQVIYAVVGPVENLHVGQQVDVFVAADESDAIESADRSVTAN